jgi:DNA-binding protein HU-beta
MNKSEMVDALAEQAGMTKADAGRAIDAIFGTGGIIVQGLNGGHKIQITGFGTFEVRERAARTGRNPQTGATITISASKTPSFRAGKGLKDAMK